MSMLITDTRTKFNILYHVIFSISTIMGKLTQLNDVNIKYITIRIRWDKHNKPPVSSSNVQSTKRSPSYLVQNCT